MDKLKTIDTTPSAEKQTLQQDLAVAYYYLSTELLLLLASGIMDGDVHIKYYNSRGHYQGLISASVANNVAKQLCDCLSVVKNEKLAAVKQQLNTIKSTLLNIRNAQFILHEAMQGVKITGALSPQQYTLLILYEIVSSVTAGEIIIQRRNEFHEYSDNVSIILAEKLLAQINRLLKATHNTAVKLLYDDYGVTVNIANELFSTGDARAVELLFADRYVL